MSAEQAPRLLRVPGEHPTGSAPRGIAGVGGLRYRDRMRRCLGEVDGTRVVPSSSGLPRGTQIDHGTAPQARDRAPRGTGPAPMHESPRHRRTHPDSVVPDAAARATGRRTADRRAAAERAAVARTATG